MRPRCSVSDATTMVTRRRSRIAAQSFAPPDSATWSSQASVGMSSIRESTATGASGTANSSHDPQRWLFQIRSPGCAAARTAAVIPAGASASSAGRSEERIARPPDRDQRDDPDEEHRHDRGGDEAAPRHGRARRPAPPAAHPGWPPRRPGGARRGRPGTRSTTRRHHARRRHRSPPGRPARPASARSGAGTGRPPAGPDRRAFPRRDGRRSPGRRRRPRSSRRASGRRTTAGTSSATR